MRLSITDQRLRPRMRTVGVAVLLVSTLPHVTRSADTTIQSIIGAFSSSLEKYILVLAGVAFVVFVWGIITFIATAGDEKQRALGRTRMMWGVIGMFILVSIWGIVTIMREIIGIDNVSNCNSPTVKVSEGAYVDSECN